MHCHSCACRLPVQGPGHIVTCLGAAWVWLGQESRGDSWTGGARWQVAPAEVWARGDSMKSGPGGRGEGCGWCRGEWSPGCAGVGGGPLPCAAPRRAVVEVLEVRRPGGQAHPAARPGVSNPNGRSGWSAGSQPPWDSLGEVPPRDGVLTAAALVCGCSRLEEQGWS